MKIKKGFVLRDVCGEQVIMGEGLGALDFGRLLTLNETAAFLWNTASEVSEFDVEFLSAKICEEYEVSVEQAKADVSEIVKQWLEVGVIE